MAPTLISRAALLLALLALGWWWWQSQRDAESTAPESLPEALLGEPDLFLEGARIRQFDPAGNLSYELRSTRIRHFEADTLTRLQEPELTLYSDDKPADEQVPWLAEAERGFIDQAPGPDGETGERVYLTDSVELQQRIGDGRFTRLRTDHLYLFPEHEYALSEQGVTIDTEVGRTKAGAMYADLKSGLIDLKASADRRVTTIVLRDQFK